MKTIKHPASCQGHRAYHGHRKIISPNKKKIVELMEMQQQREQAGQPMTEEELRDLLLEAHAGMMGQPRFRTLGFRKKDVILYPAPECMCRAQGTAADL